MMFLTSPGYTYNGSLDTAVDVVLTSTLPVSYADNFSHWSPAYFNSYVDAVHYLPCSSLLICSY